MARLLSLLSLLLVTCTTALPPNNQLPLTGTIQAAPSETQPVAVGTRDRSGNPPVCTGKQAQLFVGGGGTVISTLLTFKYPATTYKYCWLEFNAPAGLAQDTNVRVTVLRGNPPLVCPSNGMRVSFGDEVGWWKISPSGGNATWHMVTSETLARPMRSPCPSQLGMEQGVEIIPTEASAFNLVWLQDGTKGVRLRYSN